MSSCFPLSSQFQSTPPARGATASAAGGPALVVISIHAPREGGDCGRFHDLRRGGISIHAPREGGDVSPPRDCSRDAEFQSTPPARGATQRGDQLAVTHHDFNPRPPRGGRLHPRLGIHAKTLISIHAPREGATPAARETHHPFHLSSPAPRVGGDFLSSADVAAVNCISIHAPREGGDVAGVRPEMSSTRFQSTPPARGATKGRRS